MNSKHYTLSYLLLIGLSLNSAVSFAADTEIGPVDTFQFGQLTPFSPYEVRANQDICIYSSTGFYTVTIYGNGSGSAFSTQINNQKPVNYQLFWNNRSGTTGSVELQATKPSTRLPLSTDSCTLPSGQTGSIANLEMVIPAQSLQGAFAGDYSPSFRLEINAAV